MRNLKKKRRIQMLVILGTSLFAAVYIGAQFLGKEAFQFFRAPSQIIAEPPAAGEVFRLGGLVEEGTLVRGQGEAITFKVTDGGASVPVTFTGVLPDLFGEGKGMVGTGAMVDGVFVAREILAKHDENYMPKEVTEALKEQGVYRDPAQPEG